MDCQIPFVPKPKDGIYHPMQDINDIIVSAKNNQLHLKECIINLEEIVGSKGTREFIDIIIAYEHRQMTFDECVLEFLSYPSVGSKIAEEVVNDQCTQLFKQKIAYESLSEEAPTKYSICQVKYYIQHEIFRNVIFPADTKRGFFEPSFVIMGNESKEDIPQCVTICNILLNRLDKNNYSVEEKVKWWIGHRKVIFKHFSTMRSQVVRNMLTNFVAMHQKEYKNRHCNDHDSPISMLRLLPAGSDLFAEELLDLNVEKDTYRGFLDVCVSAFFSKNYFRTKMKEKLLSNFVTVSEEAFALLSLENNINRWEWMANIEDSDDDDLATPRTSNPPDLMYQNNPGKRKDSKVSAGPWKRIGLERMNDLLEKVAKAREGRQEFERAIQMMYRSGISADEVASGWIRSENAKKKLKVEHVSVTNMLTLTEV